MWIRNTARTIALLWAGFWTFFCVASAIGEGSSTLGGWMHVWPALIYLVTALIAFRWEVMGGVLLMAEGMASSFYFHAWTGRGWFVLLTLVLPAVVAGILFLFAAEKSKKRV